MPEAPPEQGAAMALEQRSDARMLVMVARTENTFESVLTALLDAGVSGATVVESRGMGAVLRSDLPIFTGLAALLPGDAGSRMVISFCTRTHIEALMRHLGTLPVDQRPVGVVLPLDALFGFDP